MGMLHVCVLAFLSKEVSSSFCDILQRLCDPNKMKNSTTDKTKSPSFLIGGNKKECRGEEMPNESVEMLGTQDYALLFKTYLSLI